MDRYSIFALASIASRAKLICYDTFYIMCVRMIMFSYTNYHRCNKIDRIIKYNVDYIEGRELELINVFKLYHNETARAFILAIILQRDVRLTVDLLNIFQNSFDRCKLICLKYQKEPYFEEVLIEFVTNTLKYRNFKSFKKREFRNTFKKFLPED